MARFGEVRHSRRKVERYVRRRGTGGPSKRVGVRIDVSRGLYGRRKGRISGEFYAHACMTGTTPWVIHVRDRRAKGRGTRLKCGSGIGSSPSTAVAQALAQLSRSVVTPRRYRKRRR